MRARSRSWRSIQLSWFSKQELDPAERAKAVIVYQRLFTQPRKLATLRTEFDAGVKQGSKNGTDPRLLTLLQGHATSITRLMSKNWSTLLDETEKWPRFKDKKARETTGSLTTLFTIYVEKTLRWLDYFVMDPRWLNLTAVNYAANAAREAASEVRDARLRFEEEFELTRDDLVPGAAPAKPAVKPPTNDRENDSSAA